MWQCLVGGRPILTVWGRANSINVEKVLWCCEELGLAYRRIDAGGSHGGTDTSEYRRMNPNRLVPTIEDDGFVLWESNVIVRYLAQKYGFARLCPSEPDRQFDGERWMDWQATTLWPVLRILFIGLIRTAKAERDVKVLSQAEVRCAEVMALLDARLTDRAFLGGDEFSMADIPAGTSAYRWYALDIVRPSFPNLTRWHSALCEREAFRKTVMLPLS